MTDPDDEPAPVPRRSRWQALRKFVITLGGLLAVIALVLYVSRWQVGRIGERELRVATQRLDAGDPDWRLDAILAVRQKNQPPPNDDAAPLVLALDAELPPDWTAWQQRLTEPGWWRDPRDNRKPPEAGVAAARAMAEPTRLLRTRALALRDKTGGTYPLAVGADPFAATFPHLDKVRRVASLLQYDGDWETLHGNSDRGIAAARAALGAARSVGDEPTLVSQLVRMAVAKVAANTALQALAWGEPAEGLTELQAELLSEADVPWFRHGMRGERAMLDRLFEGLADGTIPTEHALRYAEMNNAAPHHIAAFKAYKALLPGDRAKCLELCTLYIEASKLPPHEQLAAVRAVPLPGRPPEEFRYLLTRLMLPACERIAEAGLRVRAELLATAAGVAVERYRRKHGRFPPDLGALVPEFLPTVPLSPFDAKPLRYTVHPDRVAVWCFWPNAPQRQPNAPPEFRDGDAPGQGYGFRLWAPDQRGLPAPPPDGGKQDP